jgi:PEP-CTERM motif-containing protein
VIVMKRISFLAMVIALGFAFGTAPAKAESMSFSLADCGTVGTLCPAATYSFDVGTTSATLTIHIDGVPVAGSTNIVSVDLGFTPNNNLTLSGPVVFTDNGVTQGGIYDETYENSINSSPDCTAGGTAAFICAGSSSDGVLIKQGDTLTWTWNYTLVDPSKIDAAGDVHVGANYDPADGRIVSTTANTAVPEPNTITLLLAGLFGMGVFARRRLVHSA